MVTSHWITMRRLFIPVLLVGLAGCGGSSKPLDLGGEEGTKIGQLLEELNDAIDQPKKLKGLLAAGATVPSAKSLGGLQFYIKGKPSVQGSEGTCKVLVSSPKGEKEVDWSFLKAGDSWKIKDFKLP
jgi:hypothetical protein